MSPLDAGFFEADPVSVAKALIGTTLLVQEPRSQPAGADFIPDGPGIDLPDDAAPVRHLGGIIVETEAYSAEEPASHSFRGPTPRNRAMFGPAGHTYVYLSYGLHWCLNLVCGPKGSAVLLRALAPTHGLPRMAELRGLANPRLLCAGPGRLCQALAVTRAHDGLPLDRPPFLLLARAGPEPLIVTGSRIGISQAKELPWRFGLRGSPYLSRPFPPGS